MSYVITTAYLEEQYVMREAQPPFYPWDEPEVRTRSHYLVTITLSRTSTPAQRRAIKRARTITKRRRERMVGHVIDISPAKVTLDFSAEDERDAFIDRLTTQLDLL